MKRGKDGKTMELHKDVFFFLFIFIDRCTAEVVKQPISTRTTDDIDDDVDDDGDDDDDDDGNEEAKEERKKDDDNDVVVVVEVDTDEDDNIGGICNHNEQPK